MANEDKKDFNAMLHDNKDMPKFQIITYERGDGFRLMGSKEIFQRQSWVVQKSTMPKT